jgi:tRNA (adenine22-N1)-methyltransferase
MKLSARMQKIADLCVGTSAADVGTDHGLIPIWLEKYGGFEKLILTDIAGGPLRKAMQNVAFYDSKIRDIRLGAGLAPLAPGEADTVIIAGMGGELIASILAGDPEKTKSYRRFVLQPRSRESSLRKSLIELGLPITGEYLVKEVGRICQIIVCEPSAEGGEVFADPRVDTEVPPMLFEAKDPLIGEFLDRRIKGEEKIISQMRRKKDPSAQGSAELERHISLSAAYRAMKEKI